MPDSVTPLNGARARGLVTLREVGPQGMIALRGDLSGTALRSLAVGITGVDFPKAGGAGTVGERGLIWMSPDELLVLVPHAQVAGTLARIATALAGTHHLVADVSDARAVIRVEGPRLRDVLAKLTPADLRPAAFGPGRVRRTRLGQVTAAFWMTAPDAVMVICSRSVADHVFGLLETAADPAGAVHHF